MQPRRDLLAQFSTFLQFEGDRPRPWLTDPRLRRSMERRLGEGSTWQEANVAGHVTGNIQGNVQEANFWALFWHKQWLQHQPLEPQSGETQLPAEGAAKAAPTSAQALPQNHLTAYVQDGCYWAAYKTVSRFKNLPYGLADCFQLAIVQFHKILRGFDAAYGSDFATYANAAFASLIRETLRQRNEVDICTDWGLLRKLSKKRLAEALRSQGLGEATVQAYGIAWQGFKLYYAPTQASGTRKLTKPDGETLGAISRYYASQIREQSGLGGETVQRSATPSEIEAWLLASAKAARQYLYPTQVSVNAQQAGQETEFIDSLVDAEAQTPLEELIASEAVQTRQQQRSQLGEVLQGLLQGVDAEAQQLLGFYYRDGLTQQEMAQRLNVKQYTISRRLTRLRRGMVEKLAQWSAETLHSVPDLDLLNSISSILDEWLHQYYRSARADEGAGQFDGGP